MEKEVFMRFFASLSLLSVLFLLFCSIFVTALPPPPPDIEIIPPTYCDPTNGGVEICDSLDNDCDGAVDEDVCSSSSSSSKRSSSSSSSYIAPVIVKNTTNVTNATTNTIKSSDLNESSVSKNVSDLAEGSSGDLLSKGTEGILSDDIRTQKSIFGLSPLRILIYGSIIIILLVSLSLYTVNYFVKRSISRKNALAGTYPASQIPSESEVQQSSDIFRSEGRDMNMKDYISDMRKKGFKDDDIMIKLKNQDNGKQ